MDDPIITPEVRTTFIRLFMRMKGEDEEAGITAARGVVKPIVTNGGTGIFGGAIGALGGDLAGTLPNPTVPHITDAIDAHDASSISYSDSGSGLSADDVQEAIDQLDTDLDAHMADTIDAHDASAISNVAAGSIAATTVQAAINELDGDIVVVAAALSAHLSDTVDAHDASAISYNNTTSGLAADTVQEAIDELEAAGGGGGLTHWSEDGSGNLINDDGGHLLASALTNPITVRNFFVSGGPTVEAEGIVFEVISDNYDYGVSASNQRVFTVDDWNFEASTHGGFALKSRSSSGGGPAEIVMTDQLGTANPHFFGLSSQAVAAGVAEAILLQAIGGSNAAMLRFKYTHSGTVKEIRFGPGTYVTFPIALNAAATDLATTQALVNQIRQLLIDIGLAV